MEIIIPFLSNIYPIQILITFFKLFFSFGNEAKELSTFLSISVQDLTLLPITPNIVNPKAEIPNNNFITLLSILFVKKLPTVPSTKSA